MATDPSQRAQDIAAAASRLPPEDSASFVESVCAGDAALRAMVDGLLAGAGPRDVEAPTADPPLRPGLRRAGKFTLVSVVASGGMGTVYEGVQEFPRRTVAVKLMKPGEASAGAADRFRREAQILASLGHPNIAQVFDAGVADDGAAYIAMEFIPGARTIVEYAREKSLSLDRRLELFIPVCDAVEHGNRRGIIHRDLKPANVLVGSDGVPKVIDFGVARAADAAGARAGQTALGDIPGTVEYMSPEQCEGDPQALDARSDAYALGLILYELLCGRRAYRVPPTFADAVRAIRTTPPYPPRRANDALSADHAAVILRALDKDPDRRYASAGALRDDCERLLTGSPVRARLTPVARAASSMRSMARRHNGAALLAAAALAVVVAQQIGPWLVYSASPLDRLFARHVSPLWAPTLADQPFQSVRVVTMAETLDPQAVAAGAGIAGIDPARRQSLRKLHGAFMSRLADAQPAAVVWLIRFGSDDFADDLLTGIHDLRARSIPVLVGVKTWDAVEGRVSPLIEPHVRVAPATAVLRRTEPWWVDAALQRGRDSPRSSLALDAALSFRHPTAQPALQLDRGGDELWAQFFRPLGALLVSAGPQERIPITGSTVLSRDLPEKGLIADDRLSGIAINVPSDASLRASTIDYADAFRLSPAELARTFRGRLVFIADLSVEDAFALTPDGRTVSVAYAHATAVEALAGVGGIRYPREWHTWGLCAIGGAFGAVLARFMPGHRRARLVRGLLAMAVLTAGAITGSVLVFDGTGYLCNPAVPLLAMFLAFALAWPIPAPPGRYVRR